MDCARVILNNTSPCESVFPTCRPFLPIRLDRISPHIGHHPNNCDSEILTAKEGEYINPSTHGTHDRLRSNRISSNRLASQHHSHRPFHLDFVRQFTCLCGPLLQRLPKPHFERPVWMRRIARMPFLERKQSAPRTEISEEVLPGHDLSKHDRTGRRELRIIRA